MFWTHYSRDQIFELAKDHYIRFGRKNALFGEWIRSKMNMVVPVHVKEGRKKPIGDDM